MGSTGDRRCPASEVSTKPICRADGAGHFHSGAAVARVIAGVISWAPQF
jgi:hypothetical protein